MTPFNLAPQRPQPAIRHFALWCLATASATLLAACASSPPSAADVLSQSAQAMGASQLKTLRYVAEGTGYSFGQAFKAGGAWPKPNIPYPPESWTTAPLAVTTHGPRPASAM